MNSDLIETRLRKLVRENKSERKGFSFNKNEKIYIVNLLASLILAKKKI